MLLFARLRSLIMRVYRPIGIDKTKFQCIAHVQGRKYTTKMFIINVNIVHSNLSDFFC
jgi:hypothetical protein